MSATRVTTSDGVEHAVERIYPGFINEGDRLVMPVPDSDDFVMATVTSCVAGTFFAVEGYEDRGMLHLTGPVLVERSVERERTSRD